MSDSYKPRSLAEIMNDLLSTVRDYYDAEYAYYIEKEQGDIETIYEWCAENIEWQRIVSSCFLRNSSQSG